MRSGCINCVKPAQLSDNAGALSMEVVLWLLMHPLGRPFTEQIVKLAAPMVCFHTWEVATQATKLRFESDTSQADYQISDRCGKFGTTLSAGSLEDHNLLVRLWLARRFHLSNALWSLRAHFR